MKIHIFRCKFKIHIKFILKSFAPTKINKHVRKVTCAVLQQYALKRRLTVGLI